MSAANVFAQILDGTINFVRSHSQKNWGSHRCPHCGAGLSRIVLLSGFVNPKRGVRAQMVCRDCGRQHKLRGHGIYERHVFAVCRDNVRKPARTVA